MERDSNERGSGRQGRATDRQRRGANGTPAARAATTTRRERAMRTMTTGEFDGGSVFIDGDWKALSEAKISMFDWGFTRSDATYDVASAWRGAFFRLEDHLDRFFASVAKMRMSIPYTRAEVRA